MHFQKIISEGLAHFSYLIGDGKSVAVIDPRRDVGVYMQEARRAGMTITHIFETHRNEDYALGSMELAERTGAEIHISGHEELGHIYGTKMMDGDHVDLGEIRITALHTPGHTYGHLSFVVSENSRKTPCMVFTGDCLFMGDLGRTDFYGQEKLHGMTTLMYESIFERLLPLGDEVLVFPAHGAGSACGAHMDERPFSTIGYERQHNPYLQVDSKDTFIKKFARMRLKPRYFTKIEQMNIHGGPFLHDKMCLNARPVSDLFSATDTVIVDLRSKEAFFGGHIPGAISLDKSGLSAFLGSLFDPETPVAFVNDSGAQDIEDIYWMCRRVGFDNLVGYYPGGTFYWELSGRKLHRLETISAVDFRDLPESSDYVLLDVRAEEELTATDPQKNRLHIPLQLLWQRWKEIPQGKIVYILCASGERSATAASFLQREGYTTRVITGGTVMFHQKPR